MFVTQLSSKSKARDSAHYVGGEVRTLNESNTIHIVLAFEGSSHKNSIPLLIAQ